MAKKNKKHKKKNRPAAEAPASVIQPAKATNHQATRETVESLVIALVLAFLFRTFQAEAFVIPTGSMAPTLMGRHKDVYCEQSGQRFKVNAADEGRSPQEMAAHPIFSDYSPLGRQYYEAQTVAGTSPSCRYPMPFTPDLPADVPETQGPDPIAYQGSSSGDRILVNKYLYSFTDPKRWDVVVFKYPGDAQQNYIKRLVGLPGETLRIYQGDLYSSTGDGFSIIRKPADKVLAMRQVVHDTEYDPVTLFKAGWPLRWPTDGTGWSVDTEPSGKTVAQTYRVAESKTGEARWLEYRHTPAPQEVWAAVRRAIASGSDYAGLLNGASAGPGQLVTDFNAYNTEVQRWRLTRLKKNGRPADINRPPEPEGIHWAGDLSVDVDLRVESPEGKLLLDLVEAGQHFLCTIDIATGEATLAMRGFAEEEPRLTIGSAKTPLIGPGGYRVRYANVDDRLLLWINGRVVAFDSGGQYDAATAFGTSGGLAPRGDDRDAGDFAPVRIGSKGAALTVTQLQVFRDLYYIASRWEGERRPVTDYNLRPSDGAVVRAPGGEAGYIWEVAADPALWPVLADRRAEDFPIKEGQLFVMGDNSSSSKDCRLWTADDSLGRPGGPYLERRLLTGKAVCVYWPHALVSIPTPKRGVRIPIVPNLGDIRLVK